MILGQIEAFLKGSGYAIAIAVATYIGFWVRRIYAQKNQNELDQLQNKNDQTDFDNHHVPLDDLVAKSNESHGMVKGSGNNGSKE